MMFVSLKKRDCLINQGGSAALETQQRSLLYVLIFRLLVNFSEVSEAKALRILKMTAEDF